VLIAFVFIEEVPPEKEENWLYVPVELFFNPYKTFVWAEVSEI
jgi:hypothetical protein